MNPEIEKMIRDHVLSWKSSGKVLERGSYDYCLIAALGGIKAADKMLGTTQSCALEIGFEGWRPWNQDAPSKAFPDFYSLGKKIAEENGIK
jgi:hypothetical protein